MVLDPNNLDDRELLYHVTDLSLRIHNLQLEHRKCLEEVARRAIDIEARSAEATPATANPEGTTNTEGATARETTRTPITSPRDSWGPGEDHQLHLP